MESPHVTSWQGDFLLEWIEGDRRAYIDLAADGKIHAWTLEREPDGNIKHVDRSPHEAIRWFHRTGIQ